MANRREINCFIGVIVITVTLLAASYWSTWPVSSRLEAGKSSTLTEDSLFLKNSLNSTPVYRKYL